MLQGGIMKAKGHILQNISVLSGSETIAEQEKTECINALDDLCAVLEKYSAALTKQTSEILRLHESVNNLKNTESNISKT